MKAFRRIVLLTLVALAASPGLRAALPDTESGEAGAPAVVQRPVKETGGSRASRAPRKRHPSAQRAPAAPRRAPKHPELTPDSDARRDSSSRDAAGL